MIQTVLRWFDWPISQLINFIDIIGNGNTQPIMKTTSSNSCDFSRNTGFNLIELLVVIAIIAILASLLFPAVSSAKRKSGGIGCMNNNKQLVTAWHLYADDHEGACVPNEDEVPRYSWVKGKLNYIPDNLDNTNTTYLTDGKYALLAKYGLPAAVYRCPSDRSAAPIFGQPHQRTRSISLNQALGINSLGRWFPSYEYAQSGQNYYDIYRKTSGIKKPSDIFAFIDEHPDSINDPAFATVVPDDPGSAKFIDLPAWYHNNASAISFADGHAELHRWRDPRTLVPIKGSKQLSIFMADNQDIIWLTQRATSLAGRK
jgi:prepilin-type N-terminal cleavage/methylation domain-containing protein/prepilin-type processing-associated H-X9-DG protein